MPEIRAGLLSSEPWLALKDNVDRVCWLDLALHADPLGNQPGGPLRLLRQWRTYGIQTVEQVAKVLSDLQDVDLVRRYEVDGKPYLHLPRFRQRLRYMGHLTPLSPWTSEDDVAKIAAYKTGQFSAKQDTTQKAPGDRQAITGRSPDHHRGEVEVEVEVEALPESVVDGGSGGKTRATPCAPAMPVAPAGLKVVKLPPTRGSRLPTDWVLPDDWRDWACRVHRLSPQRAVQISLSFRDHWWAKAGADACKVDWQATWRNWVRRETERGVRV